MMSEVCLAGRGSVGRLSPEVAQLVDYLWEETSGKLKDALAVPVEPMQTEQVRGLASGSHGDVASIM